MASELPVVFLAFANELDDHLAMLKAESRDVYRALQPLQDSDRIAVHREESSELDELYEDLLQHDERVVIFHYGGHASGRTLQLEGGGAGSRGLAELLGQQSGLKLVFLNGCATKGHVSLLLQAGVPAVIATSVPIGDQKAGEFSVAFYKALAAGRSIAEAFASGSALVEAAHGVRGDSGVGFSRNSEWEDDDDEMGDSPILEWGLYTRPDSADVVEQWRLPDAGTEWHIQLEDKNGPLRDLDGNAQAIEHRSRIRTVDAVSCTTCGSTTSRIGKQPQRCPVCGSEDLKSEPARTVIPDSIVPFVITEDDARNRALDYVGADAKVSHLDAVYVPYWIFDVDTRTSFEGERGVARDFTKTMPDIQWEPLKDTIDFACDAYLVAAGHVPNGHASAPRDWYWELEQSTPGLGVSAEISSVPFDVSSQTAFDQLVAELDDDLDAEIKSQIGGVQQRNISRDTRYRSVSAGTVLLPHWYATLELESGPAGLLINGQNGIGRPLQLPGTAQTEDGGLTTMTRRTFETATRNAETSLKTSVFAGAGIGLMVGAMLGLAVSPTVAGFIGAVGAALAALLGLNDRHFSASKGLRIGAFGIFAVLGAPLGMLAKNHSVFAPDLAELKAEFTEAGYSECQALYLLADESPTRIPKEDDANVKERKDAYLKAGFSECEALSLLEDRPRLSVAAKKNTGTDSQPPRVSATQRVGSGAGLMADPVELSACDDLRALHQGLSIETLLYAFADVRSESWKTWSVTVINSGLSDDEKRELLIIGRDAVCRTTESDSEKFCAMSEAVVVEPSSDLRAVFGEFEHLAAALKKTDEKIVSPADRSLALGLITRALCGDPE